MLTRFSPLKRSIVAPLFLAVKPHLHTMPYIQPHAQHKRDITDKIETVVAGASLVGMIFGGLYAFAETRVLMKQTKEMLQSNESLKRDLVNAMDSWQRTINTDIDGRITTLGGKINTRESQLHDKMEVHKGQLHDRMETHKSQLLDKLDARESQLLDKLEAHKNDLASLIQNNITHAIGGALSITESKVKECIALHAAEDEKRYGQLKAEIAKLHGKNQATECKYIKE